MVLHFPFCGEIIFSVESHESCPLSNSSFNMEMVLVRTAVQMERYAFY